MPSAYNLILGRLAVVMACLSLVMVVAGILLNLDVQTRGREIARRQQFITESAKLSQVYNALVRILAEKVISADNSQLRQILNESGINITPDSGKAPSLPLRRNGD